MFIGAQSTVSQPLIMALSGRHAKRKAPYAIPVPAVRSGGCPTSVRVTLSRVRGAVAQLGGGFAGAMWRP